MRRSAESLEAAGLNVEVFAFRGQGLYSYAAAWMRLRPRLHPGRYDLVHTQDAGALLTLPHRVPLVETITRIQPGARFLSRRANAIIVPSEELGRRLRTRAAIHVLPPSLDERSRVALLVDLYRTVINA
ncbi:MAG TPA: glycosyltransferase [Gemmatimonadales bacterium]|nr:glycosyltransferase [Gemmatimonadales bacterium]